MNFLPQRRHFEEHEDTVDESSEMNVLPQRSKFVLARDNFMSELSKESQPAPLDTSSNGQKMVHSQSLPTMNQSKTTLKMTQTPQSQPRSQTSTPARDLDLFNQKLFGGFKRTQPAMSPAEDTGPDHVQQGLQQRPSESPRYGRSEQLKVYICISIYVYV